MRSLIHNENRETPGSVGLVTETVEYDPTWSSAFEQAAAQLREAGDRSWLIEHIGSTCIPGLSGKPIIDLAVRVDSADDLEARRRDLADGGWLAIRRQPRSHRVLVRERDGKRTHIAHFFTAARWEACHQRLFRDWIRADPDDLARYREAKRRAALADPRDYTKIKEPVVLQIVNRARASRGWPPVDDLDPEDWPG